MPRSWYDAHELTRCVGMDDAVLDLYLRILADKKPYFMRYIYPSLMSDYNTYISKTSQKSLMEFGMTINELKQIPEDQMTKDQQRFMGYYYSRLPVSTGDCVMNRICRKVEEFVDSHIKPSLGNPNFDYSFMKSDGEYTRSQYLALNKLYSEHKDYLKNHKKTNDRRHSEKSESAVPGRAVLASAFGARCRAVCSNDDILCNILIDICYKHEGTKQFVWDVCGKTIFKNLFNNSGGMIEYPVSDEDGDIEYAGQKFTMRKKESDIWLKSL